jgi:hypothetical protein
MILRRAVAPPMGPQQLTRMHTSLRQLILALVLFGIIGLEIELALLRHAESFSQWLPHIFLLLGLVLTAAVHFRPGATTLRAFRVLMVLYLLIGALGVFFHLKGNVEFALERNPSLGGMPLLWKALRGATPALAPGALAQLGLLGLLYTYRHPALVSGSSSDRIIVD